MILFINACVRSNSRTLRLAERFLSAMTSEIKEVCLENIAFPLTDQKFLTFRDNCIKTGDFSAEIFQLAKDFAAADEIVIAAPYWDLSFPAALKQYFEQINVLGLTFVYTEEGFPRSLCKAEKLTYITTSGGPIISDEFGFGYIKALANNFYGISDVNYIKAEGLDIIGADVEKILDNALK